jgi:hypothetical protein
MKHEAVLGEAAIVTGRLSLVQLRRVWRNKVCAVGHRSAKPS